METLNLSEHFKPKRPQGRQLWNGRPALMMAGPREKERMKMKKVINEYGTKIWYDVAVNLMDDEIREELHETFAPCTDQKFFDECF